MLKKCDVLQISGEEKLGPYKEGEEVKLPYWQAKILVKQDYAKYIDLKPIQTGDLHKILYRELPNPQLTSIDPDFYVKIHEDLLELSEEYQKNPDLRLLQKIEKIKSLFRDVASRRFYKLLRIASTAPGERSELFENCTNEEKKLLESLRRILEDWEAQFIV